MYADSIYDTREHAQKYVLERSTGRKKKDCWQRRFIQISTTLFLKYLFIIFLRALLTHTLTHGYTLTPAQAIRKWIYLFDYMVATALDQWNERDTLISLLIIL